jgi:LuxR family maltose regulon positive regulatory protein
MPTALLTSKLHIPSPRPGMVPRPHLVARLDAALGVRKLTLISAPAGFGKTTLLSEWAHSLRAAGTPVAWISLDSGDNDLMRFLAYLIAALQTQTAMPEAAMLQSLALATPPPSVQPVLTPLINEIAAILNHPSTGSGQCLVLILDDYHLITAQPIHDALAFLVDHLPEKMQVVVATRADPPLPIARLRGRGELTELRQSDLRFTRDEAAAFLNQAIDLQLEAEQVTTLATRTEGWIAGLQMAALALRRITAGTGREPQSVAPSRSTQVPRDVAAFIQAFTGSNRYILDYLVEEVLQRQPKGIQAFLLQTCILERMCGPLCDAVLEVGERGPAAAAGLEIGSEASQSPVPGIPAATSQAILEYLDSSNLFIVPLDNDRRWYRYHRLFAGLLRRRLHQQIGEQGLASLHRRASAWFEGQGLAGEAIDHALRAGDFERAAHLIEQVARDTLMRSEVATFLSWVERLPDRVEHAHPALSLLHAWALLLSGRPLATIEARIEDATRLQDTAGHPPGGADSGGAVRAGLPPGQVAPLRAFIAAFQGRSLHAAELSRRALDQLPADDLFMRGIATWNLGISYLLRGDTPAASQALDEAARMSREAGNVMVAVMALCTLAELCAAWAQLPRAQELYQQALDLATDRQGMPLPIAGMALIGLGELSREWNDLEAAAHYLNAGIEQIDKWGEIGAIDGYLSLARVKQAQGDPDGALELLGKARQLALQFDTTELDDLIVATHQVQIWIAQGALEAARQWVEERRLEKGLVPELAEGQLPFEYHLRKHEQLTWARVLLATGRPGEALALLEPWLAVVEQLGGQGSKKAIELQILQALALQAQRELELAVQALARALSAAKPGGYMRIFLDEGAPMAHLLEQFSLSDTEVAGRGISPGYVQKLLAEFSAKTNDQRRKTKPTPTSSLIEPLTKRELQILRLLAGEPWGRSTTEIAHELGVSANTVRYHLKHIYGKLGVHRKADAIARAEDLDLL